MDTAEAWVARLASPDFNQRDRAEFEAWCAGSNDHLQAYVQADRLNERVRELASDPLIAAAARAARRNPASTGLRWIAMAAGLATAALLGLWQWNAGGEQRFDTRVGEQREILLGDGTRAKLDTDSEIRVSLLGAQRELRLQRGRVELDIAKAEQPFVAFAGNGTIRDIGTRFQLARHGDRVEVLLLEGEVSIQTAASAAPAVLKPGMLARYDGSGEIRSGVADVEAAQGWTRGELVFKHRPLGELLAEMNRYSPTQLRLGENSLESIAVSGLFHAGDQEALIKALESGWSLKAERVTATDVVLHSAQLR